MKSKFTIGLGLGVLLGAVGAYLIYGTKKGFKARMKAKWWMIKAKGEILEKLSQLEEFSEDAYQDIVDKVVKNYKHIKGIGADELAEYSEYLKDNWKEIKRQICQTDEEGKDED